MPSPRDSYKKPNIHEGGNNFKKPFPINSGKTLFRLVPTLPEIQGEGKWYTYIAQHFGYKVLNREGEERHRTFVCPRVYNSRTKEEKVPCAECHKIERQETLLEQRIAEYKKEGLAEKAIETRVAGLRAWLSAHNKDAKYYVHVMDTNNEFGYMKFPWMAYDDLKKRIAELDEQGIDAFDPDGGVWFEVERTGTGKYGTKYAVKVAQETVVVDGRRVNTDRKAPLTDDQLDKAIRDCPKFDKMATVLSSNTIKQLAESQGTPEEVSAILGLPVDKREYESEAAEEPEADYSDEQAEVEVVVAAPPKPVAPQKTPEELEMEEMEAKLAAMKAKRQATAATQSANLPPSTPKTSPKVEVNPVLNPKNKVEDFIALFGED